MGKGKGEVDVEVSRHLKTKYGLKLSALVTCVTTCVLCVCEDRGREEALKVESHKFRVNIHIHAFAFALD